MTEQRRALVLRRAEVHGRIVDVRCDAGRITAVERQLAATPGVDEIDMAGAGVLPGLHDHHIHVLALAAHRRSVDLGPELVASPLDLATIIADAHRSMPAGRWLRATGYHESFGGELDRWTLDALTPGRPARVQHRSGAMWVLSTVALQRLAVPAWDDDGVERDARGLTGRLFGLDERLRHALDDIDGQDQGASLDVSMVGSELIGYGVTAITDATAYSTADAFDVLVAAVADGSLPQRLTVTGGPALAGLTVQGVAVGPVKIVIADHALPSLEALCDDVRRARAHGRSVAVHCVTRAALVLALAAWDEVGPMPGDRVEHGALIDDAAARRLGAMGVVVVTQPGFVVTHGDRYLSDVDAGDIGDLYRCATLLAPGVGVAGSTDAPFGPADPWVAVTAAMHRTTRSGQLLGPQEALGPMAALRLFLGRSDDPAGPPRAIAVGEPADLCLLNVAVRDVLEHPSSQGVAGVVIDGVAAMRR